MSRVLRLADIEKGHVSAVPSQRAALSANLAMLLRVDEAAVAARMHPERMPTSRPVAYINFYGSVIRARYRENKLRRVSPRSLQASPYHRAMWDLRPFSFCVDSRELLLTRCPLCECTLGWSTTLGIPYCERCVDADGRPKVDLRDHPQPLVSAADEAALSFACDVVHPDADRRMRAKRSLAPEFSQVASGDLLDVIVYIGRVITAETDTSGRVLRRFSPCEYHRLTPDVLAKAARSLMNWPSAFFDLVEEQRSRANAVPGAAGSIKEMGGLQWLAWDVDLSEAVKTVFSEANAMFVERLETRTATWAKFHRKTNLEGYITRKEATRILAANKSQMAAFMARPEVTTMHFRHSKVESRIGLILFRADQVTEAKKIKADLIRTSTAAVRLGIPLWAVEKLCRLGKLTEEFGPAIALGNGGPMLRESSFNALLDAMTERVLPYDGRVPDDPPLITTVAKSARIDMPWVAFIEAVLDGTLTLRASGQARKNGFTSNVCLVEPTQLDALCSRHRSDDGEIPQTPMTDVEASVVIGAKSHMISKLVSAGLLGSNGASARRVTKEHLATFKAEYALTPEVARALRIRPRDVRKKLADSGVHPVAALKGNLDLVWRRQDLPQA